MVTSPPATSIIQSQNWNSEPRIESRSPNSGLEIHIQGRTKIFEPNRQIPGHRAQRRELRTQNHPKDLSKRGYDHGCLHPLVITVLCSIPALITSHSTLHQVLQC